MGDDGKFIEKYTGLRDENGTIRYYDDGIRQKGAVQVGDDIYYFGAQSYATLADGKYYISEELTNGLFDAGSYFIRDGKVFQTGLIEINGKLYYLENYQKKAGAVQVGDDIYYFGANTKTFLADGTYYISAALMNDVDLPAGNYTIQDGKIVVKNGIYEENGKVYFYRNNKKVKGCVEVDGDYYYFSAKYYALEDGRYYISESYMNGLLPAGTYNIKDYKIVLDN